jgi:Transglutaminase-like superfamily
VSSKATASGWPETAKHRAGVLARLAARPADCWLVTRMLAWRMVLPVLKRVMPLRRLTTLMWADHSRPRPDRGERIVALGRLVFRSGHPKSRDNCLDRSLVLYRYLSGIGAKPRLIVGFRRESGRVLGHAWVTQSGVPVGDAEPAEPYAQVTSFGEGGLPIREVPGE